MEENLPDDGIEIYSYGNQIFIKADGAGEVQVEVYDLLGQNLTGFENLLGLNTMTLSGFDTGFYLVKAKTETSVKTKKVFIR